nr:hypothetical protein [Tanacetum cinerariifolium]
MKKLIMDLPSLTPPWEKETLYAYLAVFAEAVSAILLTDKKGRQCPMQYLSRILNETERNYAPMEKLALSLIHMTRRLRRYFEAHPVKVITDQPIKNILNNTETSRKLAIYDVELGAYNITFIPHNAVKGQILADFLSEAPKGEKEELYFRMPEACKDSMIKYLAKAREYASIFKSFSIENIPRNMNQKADVLSKLASVAFNEVLVEVLNKRSTESQEVHTVIEEEWDNWMTHIIRCLDEEIWPKDKNEARCLQAKIGQYAMESRILFTKGYLVPMLRCMGPLQANYVIHEIHMGSCGIHVGLRAVVRKAIRQGYYWTTMHEVDKKEVENATHYGMDILGPLPPARGGAKFVIMAIDYFTKWIEAKPLVRIIGNEEEGSPHGRPFPPDLLPRPDLPSASLVEEI